MPQVVHKTRDLHDIRNLVRMHQPRVVVIAGRHEPYEPGARFLEKIPFLYRKPEQVLLIEVPESFRPVNFGKRGFERLMTNTQDVLEKHTEFPGLNPQQSQRVARSIMEVWEGIQSGRWVFDQLKTAAAHDKQNLPERKQRRQMLALIDQAYASLQGTYSAQGLAAALQEAVAAQMDQALATYGEMLADTLRKYEVARYLDFGRLFDQSFSGWKGHVKLLRWIDNKEKGDIFKTIYEGIGKEREILTDEELYRLVCLEAPFTRQVNLHFSTYEQPHNLEEMTPATRMVTMELAGIKPYLERRLLMDDESKKALHFFAFLSTLGTTLKINRTLAQAGETYVAVTEDRDIEPYQTVNAAHFHETVGKLLKRDPRQMSLYEKFYLYYH